MLFLDFDGVLVNSAFEAFRMLLTTKGEIKNPSESHKDELFKKFNELRPFVGAAWNYFYVFESITKNIAFDLPNSPTAEDVSFEESFFNTRNYFKFKNLLEWINLHKTYPFSLELPLIIEQGFILSNQILIITHKDAGAVKALIRQFIPALSNTKILSLTDFDYSTTKKDIIINYMDNKSVNYFIDDSINICQDTMNNIKSSELRTYLADWGYSTSDQRAKSNCNMVSCKEIINILSR